MLLLVLCGAGHFLIELSCSWMLTRGADESRIGLTDITLFNVLAFGLQPLIGWAADRWRAALLLAFVGALLVLGAITLPPAVGLALLGLGNGCFHIGAGCMSIKASNRRLLGLGIFVGPGALGLTLGIGLARTPLMHVPIAIALVMLLILCGVWFARPRSDGLEPTERREKAQTLRLLGLAVPLVLLCIAIRSFVGLGMSFSWNTTVATAIGVGLALAVGKITGGWLADRMGWIFSVVLVLIVSVPTLWLGAKHASSGLIGIALFQAPMAVTLGTLVRFLPGRPGLAFGLASAAVYVGSIFLQGELPVLVFSFGGLSLLSLLAICLLVLALHAGSVRAD